MCWFVIVAYSRKARPAARGLLRSAHHLRETDNPSILAALPADWEAGYLADGGNSCGCDMYADPRTPDGLEEKVEKFRRKHSHPRERKNGWTDAKIERAILQMTEDHERQSALALRGLRIDVRRSIAELARTAGPVRMVVHPFRGRIGEERINADEQRLSADRFVADESLVEPDVWYEIVGK